MTIAQRKTGSTQPKKAAKRRGRTLVLTPGEADLIRAWYVGETSTGAYLSFQQVACILAIKIRKTTLGKRLCACCARRYVPRAVVRALAGVARPPRGSGAEMPRPPRARQMTIFETSSVQQGGFNREVR